MNRVLEVVNRKCDSCNVSEFFKRSTDEKGEWSQFEEATELDYVHLLRVDGAGTSMSEFSMKASRGADRYTIDELGSIA